MLRLGIGALGVGWVEGKMERRLVVVGGGPAGWEEGVVALLLPLCGMLLSVGRGWVPRCCSLFAFFPSCLMETWASRVVILGSGVSGSEESGLDRFSLFCICLELCHDAEPDGLIFRGRVKGCDVLRRTGSL